MTRSITIQRATSADIADLVRLRRLMFEAMGYDDPAQLDAADAAAGAYFAAEVPAGRFHGWLALTSEDLVVGSGGIVVDHHPPKPHESVGARRLHHESRHRPPLSSPGHRPAFDAGHAQVVGRAGYRAGNPARDRGRIAAV